MTIPALSAPPSAKLPHVAEVLRAAFQTIVDPRAIAVVTVPAPLAPLEALLEAAPAEDALVWHPAEGPSFAAVGAIATLRGEGPDRVAEISRCGEQRSGRTCERSTLVTILRRRPGASVDFRFNPARRQQSPGRTSATPDSCCLGSVMQNRESTLG